MAKLKKYLVCEAHEILHSTHCLPLSELRVVQLCLAKTYMKEGIQKDTWYPVDKKLYSQIFNISEEAAYMALLETVLNLKNRSIVLKSKLLDPTQPENSKTVIGWVDECRYNNDTLQLELKWTSAMASIINQLGTEYSYSKYYLEDVCKLKSIHSMRLYRILNTSAWRCGMKLTLEELRRLLGIEEELTYLEFKKLNQHVIAPAVVAINELTNLTVEVIPVKLGRKISSLQFKVTPKIVIDPTIE